MVFQGSQWDSVIAVRVRKLLLNIVKKYADAEQTQAPVDSANTAVKAAQGPSLFAMAVALQDSPTVKPTTAQGKGEVKLYPRGRVPKAVKGPSSEDVEGSAGASHRKASDDKVKQEVNIPASSADFSFEGLTYDIPVKGGTRRLLDHVDGWVKVRLFSSPSF